MASINYNEIQNRVNFLYRQIWFNPDAYYPTLFGYANNVQDIYNMVKIFDAICVTKKEAEADKNLVEGAPKSVKLDTLVKIENDFLEKIIGDNGQTASYEEDGKKYLKDGLNTFNLAIITKIEGLKIPETPLDRVNGRIVAREQKEGKAENIKITFLLQDDGTALTFNKRWQNEWFRYDSKSRKLKAMSTGEDAVIPEGYLGMDYVHILPDGTCKRIGHLFVAGLIPVKLDIGRGFALGPGGEKNNAVTTLTVSYVYAQAMLVIDNGTDSSEVIYFE